MKLDFSLIGSYKGTIKMEDGAAHWRHVNSINSIKK